MAVAPPFSFNYDCIRVVVAGSAFSSVTTAIECRKKGLFYSGIVKTASREFPKDYLDDPSKYAGRGNHMTLTTTIENCKLIALGWKDKTIKKFISTCGTTQPDKPHEKHHYTRDGDVVVSEVPRPQLVSQYFDAASKIDVHNHLRQGLLNIEDVWGTQTWRHHLAATLFGVTVTDALIAYNYEHSASHTMRDFVNELALSLIFNEMEGYDTVQQRRQFGESVPPTAPPPVPHMAIPFHTHPLENCNNCPCTRGKCWLRMEHIEYVCAVMFV